MRATTRLNVADPITLPTSVEPLIDARGLEKWYGHQPAVRGIDFTLLPGEFLVLFGPNGAGKTTLLRMLSGSLKPTAGSLRLAGMDQDTDEHGWRRRIGVLSHQTFLYGQMTAEENLRFYGRLYALDALEQRIGEMLSRVGLHERRTERVRTFSRGMQQRLAVARTLLHDPELVLLDEPYTGLDPHAARMLRGILETLHDGSRTVVLVTHNILQGLELAGRVVVQVGGRWVSDEPISAIEPSTFEQVYTERVGGAL
jgi:heme exporter protein A